jgi:hypothetical protein
MSEALLDFYDVTLALLLLAPALAICSDCNLDYVFIDTCSYHKLSCVIQYKIASKFLLYILNHARFTPSSVSNVINLDQPHHLDI